MIHVAADVIVAHGLPAWLSGLDSPLGYRAVNEAQVADTGPHLGSQPGLAVARESYRRQHADDRHDDHNFDEGEASFSAFWFWFHVGLSFLAA